MDISLMTSTADFADQGQAPAPTRRYSIQEWEQQKLKIEQLYVKEQRSLKDVMRVLESESGFIATAKQFKTRLKKWGFDIRYVKGDMMIRLARVREKRRRLENKDSTFRVNKKPVDGHKIDRYLQRNNILGKDLLSVESPQCDVPSPAFSVVTPGPSFTSPVHQDDTIHVSSNNPVISGRVSCPNTMSVKETLASSVTDGSDVVGFNHQPVLATTLASEHTMHSIFSANALDSFSTFNLETPTFLHDLRNLIINPEEFKFFLNQPPKEEVMLPSNYKHSNNISREYELGSSDMPYVQQDSMLPCIEPQKFPESGGPTIENTPIDAPGSQNVHIKMRNLNEFAIRDLSSRYLQQPMVFSLDQEPYRISSHFELQSSRSVTSDSFESAGNFWESIVWPMAMGSLAVMYAIFARVTSRNWQKSELNSQAAVLYYRVQCVKLLRSSLVSGKSIVAIEAGIATSLILPSSAPMDGLELWDLERHLRGARLLLAHALLYCGPSSFSRLKLLNEAQLQLTTLMWLACKVQLSVNLEDNMWVLDSILKRRGIMDPFMANARILFSLLQDALDASRQVRFGWATSAGLLAVAKQFKRNIEDWTHPIISEVSWTDEELHALDFLYSYRATVLIYMCQVFPELRAPSDHNLHQTILNRLTMILPASSSIILLVFPLLVAGGDACTPNSRAQVKDAWKTIGRKTWVINIYKCLNITQEVWRRRDKVYQERESNDLSSSGSLGTSNGGMRFDVCEANWTHVMDDWGWKVPF